MTIVKIEKNILKNSFNLFARPSPLPAHHPFCVLFVFPTHLLLLSPIIILDLLLVFLLFPLDYSLHPNLSNRFPFIFPYAQHMLFSLMIHLKIRLKIGFCSATASEKRLKQTSKHFPPYFYFFLWLQQFDLCSDSLLSNYLFEHVVMTLHKFNIKRNHYISISVVKHDFSYCWTILIKARFPAKAFSTVTEVEIIMLYSMKNTDMLHAWIWY